MAQRTVTNTPTFSETQNAAQQSVRPDIQPAVQNFLAQQQLTQARTHQSLADQLAQAHQNIESLKADPEIADLQSQTNLRNQQAELAGRKASTVGPDVFDLSTPPARPYSPEEATTRTSLENAAAARAAAQAAKDKKTHPVPSAEVAKIGEIRSLMSQLKPVQDSYTKSLDTKGDSPFVGPKDARVQSLKQYTPLANKDFATFKQDIAGVKNKLLNMLSGAAISPAEYKRLVEALPDENKNEGDFQARLTGFSKVQNDILKEKLLAFKQAGYDTSGLEGGEIARGIGTQKGDAESRYNELLAAGTPEDEIYSTLAQEGF